MRLNDVIYAKTHYEFLNNLLGTNYKAFMKSGLTLADGNWLWMIRLGKYLGKWGWINYLETPDKLIEDFTGNGEFESPEHITYVKARKIGKHVPAFENRVIFEIVDCGNTRKYIFQGVFTLDINECTDDTNIWIKIADEYNFKKI